MTFNAWLQYLFWCRRFNRVVKISTQENMRRILKRMKLFTIYVHDNRNFKWYRDHLYVIMTFRALKENAKINK
jgi:hypothetical protein